MKKSTMPAARLAALGAARPSAVLSGPRAHAGESTETLLREVQAQLDRVTSKLQQTAETALSEARRAGEVSAGVKQTADQLLTVQTGLKASLDRMTADLEGLTAKQLEIEQHLAEAARPGGDRAVSLGAAIVAEEDRIKAFLKTGCSGVLRIEVSNAITTAAGSGGGLIYHEEERDPVRMPRRRLRIRQLLNTARTSSDLVSYRRQTTRSDAAAPVAEEGAFPASSYGWSKATSPVTKLAHHTNISEEAMADADQLRSEIDGELRYGLDLEEETQLLSGDGVGENLAGLLTEAPAFAAPAGLPNDTRVDRLRLALLQLALADYIGTAFVLNPTDWAAIDLLKVGPDDMRYVFGAPGSASTPMLWGKDVAESNTMSAGEWLAGDLFMAATIYDRADAEVLISSEHGTNFVEGLLTMRGQKRLALAIKRPAAMVTGDFTFA